MAEELERRFGGAPPPLDPLPNVVEEAEKRLIAGRGDISKLDRRHCKAVPYILWSSPQGWSNNARLIGDYLAWADREWRTAPRQLWRHYLLNMDLGSLPTQRLGIWLAARTDKLPPALHDFSEKWSLFSPQPAIRKLADSLLGGSDFIAEIENLRIGRKTLIESAFLLSVLKALGQRLQDYRQGSDIAITLKSLLADLGETPTYKMQGPEDLRRSTLKSLVEGLVAWAERQGGIAVDQTLDLLHSLIGDPRLYPIRWKDIDPNKRETVERWLTKVTLDAFFRVIRELRTDRDDMVEERERFWRGFEKSILRAWLITASDGLEIARRLLGQSFGKFETGLNVQRDHLGLMLQIGNYAILEMNKTGSTLFWPVADQQMPAFFRQNYSRSKMLSICSDELRSVTGRFRLKHQPGWQWRYSNELRRIGVFPNG
ncbi:MAG: EH signature domain-containing protein [Candidatus Contendobacter sp.]|nr:EH signature domain-containing protein [Candidatus Contendobacter sp.]